MQETQKSDTRLKTTFFYGIFHSLEHPPTNNPSGMTIKEEDCGIGNSTIPVIYSADEMLVTYNDGTVAGVDSLIGEFVDPSSDGFDLLAAEGYDG